MFCSKCGKEISEGIQFCPFCGTKTQKNSENDEISHVKVILAPEEVVEHKEPPDSGKTFSGTGSLIGMACIIISIIGDVIAMCTIGADGAEAFVPIITISTILFVIGILIKIFAP